MRAITLPSRLTPAAKTDIAWQMAAHARALLHGDIAEPSTWRCALRRAGCMVVVVQTDRTFVASFNPSGDSTRYPVGEVVYNVAQSRRMQVRGLAHEFGHALCHEWVAQTVYDVDVVYSYHDDPRSVRHQIARAFERMMVG